MAEERRAHVSSVTVDRRDPHRLAASWCELLGVGVAGELGDT